MANTKIKRLSAYEKQRLEHSYKRAGNKVVRKLEKNKNFIENYLKNLLAQPTKNEIHKKGFETEQTAKKLIKDTIEDIFQLPIEALSLRNFWKKFGFKIYNSVNFSYEE